MHLLSDIGGQVYTNGNEVAVAVRPRLAGRDVIGGNGRHIDELDLNILELYHSGQGDGGCEGKICDVGFGVCQCGDDGAFAAVWGAEQDGLACAASLYVEDVGVFSAGFFLGGLF